jgi:hypothetical protein
LGAGWHYFLSQLILIYKAKYLQLQNGPAYQDVTKEVFTQAQKYYMFVAIASSGTLKR